jgi:hypothetical protein
VGFQPFPTPSFSSNSRFSISFASAADDLETPGEAKLAASVAAQHVGNFPTAVLFH